MEKLWCLHMVENGYAGVDMIFIFTACSCMDYRYTQQGEWILEAIMNDSQTTLRRARLREEFQLPSSWCSVWWLALTRASFQAVVEAELGSSHHCSDLLHGSPKGRESRGEEKCLHWWWGWGYPLFEVWTWGRLFQGSRSRQWGIFLLLQGQKPVTRSL